MRRSAVVFALALAFVAPAACTSMGRLTLPGDNPDGGSGGAPGSTGTGGRASAGGAFGSGGAFGWGGSAGAGGTFGLGGASGAGGRPTGVGGRQGNAGMVFMCSGSRDPLGAKVGRAEVVLAVGRNSTMNSMFGNTTRMLAVQQSIRWAVGANQAAVKFGYQDFSSIESCGSGSSCCANYKVVNPALSNSGAIENAMMHCDLAAPANGCVAQSSSRPIADALLGVGLPPSMQRLPLFIGQPSDDIERRYVLLVDGPPGCSQEDATTSCNNAKTQITQVRDKNVRIHVVPIGMDAETSSECLGEMALLGEKSSDPSRPFKYHARDPDELTDTLYQISGDAAQAACTITLLQIPSGPVALEIDSRPVPPDDVNGWSFAPGSPGTIRVRGDSCIKIQHTSDVRVWACR